MRAGAGRRAGPGGGAGAEAAARPSRAGPLHAARGGPGPGPGAGLGRRGGRWPAGGVAGVVFPGRRRGVPAAAPPPGLRAGSGNPSAGGSKQASVFSFLLPLSRRPHWAGAAAPERFPREPVWTQRLGEEEERPGQAETLAGSAQPFQPISGQSRRLRSSPRPQGPPLSEATPNCCPTASLSWRLPRGPNIRSLPV